ncbi:MAG: hypothetical protein UY96_C0011G0037 [Parcubacteria group bacterium GW2011_GWB1_56_8]|nr:MAG: hypothetical protein UY96_C0011G0037 [Parcubacteria group bacterium GW2011_GWB1_56_8]
MIDLGGAPLARLARRESKRAQAHDLIHKIIVLLLHFINSRPLSTRYSLLPTHYSLFYGCTFLSDVVMVGSSRTSLRTDGAEFTSAAFTNISFA